MAQGRVPQIVLGVKGVSASVVNGYACCTITYQGETKTLTEWSKVLGIKKQTLYCRLAKPGATVEVAFEKAVQHQEFHGMHDVPEYPIWQAMVNRCTMPANPAYRHYGGRGITCCQRWLDSFQAFFQDMGKRPSLKHSIDRIDNDKGYEPGNVRWATRVQQARNTRRNVFLEWNGRRMTVVEWSNEVGLDRVTLWQRLFTLGWSVERALTTPAGPNGPKK
jgi:hypothetical protein